MVKQTIIYGSPVHRKKSSDIDGHDEIASLAANMKETLKKCRRTGNGSFADRLSAIRIMLLKSKLIHL